MNKATLDDLINDFRNIATKQNFLLPFPLHDGLRKMQEAFGSSSAVMEWLKMYQNGRHI